MQTGNSARLLPSVVDDLARSDPTRILYSFTKTRDPADGFEDVVAADFARAVDRCSWFLHETLGPGKDFPTLVYLGPQDLNYGILVLACIKVGYKLLLVSARNTIEAHVFLLEQTECHVFLTPPNFPLPIVKQILAARPMRHVEVAGFRSWLSDDGPAWKPYPYTKTFSEAKGEPFVVLHTSGSTGLPKPIMQTHGTASALYAFAKREYQDKTFPSVMRGKRVYVTFPLFHCAGISLLLPACIYADYTAVLAPFPPSTDIINKVHVHGNVQSAVLVPSTMEELVKDPEHLENLSRLDHLMFGGGPVTKTVGDLIITKTQILNCLGSTECGALPGMLPEDPRDWQYLRLHPNVGFEYRHVADNLYEQVMVRDEDLLHGQGIFATFPDLAEWPMKDIYEKHPDPTKGDYWLYRGRSDDIIVFSTGEKINPNEMEDTINRNPAISAALVTGEGRFQSSLLVEAINPPANAEEEHRLLEAIWPSVEAANKECPSYGRIHRNMVAFTSAAKPMFRAGKGTVQRKMTLNLYAAEINSLYEKADAPAENPTVGSDSSYGSIEDAIKTIVASSTEIDASDVSPDSDLFELGLDSLQVTTIVKKLNELISFHGKPESIAPRTVYANPTLATLTNAISVIIHGKESSNESAQEKLEQLYQLHSANMPISARPPAPKSSVPSVVLLTGSTGSLGSYILDVLQRDPSVSRIYCLSRGPDSHHRQERLQASKGLQPLSSKVQCLDNADLTKSHFGLPTETYKALLEQVTHVVHNAWQVDFNRSVHSFAAHVAFVRRLVDFSAHARFGAALFFVSSISAVGGVRGIVPERVLAGWDAPAATGYGQSKFVAERLLDAAAREAGVPAAFCRVGQVAGPSVVPAGATAAEWPRKEWLPSLVASSKYLGMVPGSLGPQLDAVDWIPVDQLGKVIVELAIHAPPPPPDAAGGATVYHAVNPQTAAWADLLPAVTRHLGRGGEAVKVVPLETWVGALRASEARVADIAENPAVKLLDFYESLTEAGGTTLSTEYTLGASPTLSAVGPVQSQWMDNWMKQWAF